ncbi:MAG TPA: transaldolase family protein [Atribacterota bacterium]|nr:transaldolase family protein [Atribacterota bacterium]
MTNRKEKSVLERLIEVNPEAEIWWDSSPVIYDDWAQDVLKEIPEEDKKIVQKQLKKFYNLEDPQSMLFRGVTTNPSLSMAVFEIQKAYWEEFVDGLIDKNPEIDQEGLFWMTYKEIVKRGAQMYLPLFEKSNHKNGYISAQVDPRDVDNKEKMLEQAYDLVKLSPNVMIKIPGSKQGYEVIKILTSKGIATNNTLSFILPQFMACANAVKEGLEIAKKNKVDLTRWRSVITDMMARWGDMGDLQGKGREIGIELSEADVRCAEIAIIKKAHKILKEKNHPSKMLVCSMRVSPPLDDKKVAVWHLEKIAGGNFVYTCPPKFIKALILKYDDLEFTNQIDEEIPKKVLDKLLKVPYFTQAYFEDGLTADEFIDHPAVVATAKEFSKRTIGMVDFVSSRLEKKKSE